ncbi:beta-ketoacyl-ACP synthase [Paeniroseomonas aquatica]|uniref:Beta-ketoacyl-ACP synthase n=1 Tax=Paeniroseomonas aquatica TaxID=373043 RepID=A0ABT8AF92_9PROT|nr:beta-ketoacyl-ACP synthase [Paeniroseomonas aquatica]MDN3568395.1 beta-ketoacyl-ACP synthase [Paeniroseomonas aquatica]
MRAMWPLRISAGTAVTALGAGLAPLRAALRDRRGGLLPCAFPGAPPDIWIGAVPGIEAVALTPDLAAYDCRNNRLAELALRSDGFAEAVAAARERHGAERIAVVLGTSTAGIEQTEQAYAGRTPGETALPADFDYGHTHDLRALPAYLRARLGLRGPALVVSTACTSGARAMMEAAALIAAGLVDAAVAGGVDSLCRLTLHGFSALELLSPGPCRPCAGDRDGITIGEGAGLVLLERPFDSSRGPLLLGAGASSDGHHMSSPHPEGLGAVNAMRAALAAAGLTPAEIDYVNLHGTGTRANDAMEDSAMHQVFGATVPCSSTKGWTGHALGASGAIEALVAALCIEEGLVPGCLGIAAADPAFRTDVATGNRARPVRRVLSNSFGFGGSNCSLVIGQG